MFAQRTTLDPLPGPIRDRMRVVTFRKPSADDLDARLPAVIADLIRNAVLTRAGCRCSVAPSVLL
jgi:ATP-dependent Lon protease